MGKPIFFTQYRPGLNGKLFKLYKFRTMTSPLPADKGSGDVFRIPKFGSFMRSTSLDELPELLNVVFGDMSIVGPRPLLVEYLPLYSSEQARRHDVRPGITGWAQINGRNAISWKEKFQLDLWYVNNRTFFLDLKIIFITINKVINRESINSSRDNTMTKFNGSN
jgi:lipopolysaccharide/colanic/teichoic acid biosynthesis glycosyltransferase